MFQHIYHLGEHLVFSRGGAQTNFHLGCQHGDQQIPVTYTHIDLLRTVNGIHKEFNPGQVIERDFFTINGFGMGALLEVRLKVISFTWLQVVDESGLLPLNMARQRQQESEGNEYASTFHMLIKVAIIVCICFVIQITIYTFVLSEKLAVPALRYD
jgi:hypothetical protein